MNGPVDERTDTSGHERSADHIDADTTVIDISGGGGDDGSPTIVVHGSGIPQEDEQKPRSLRNRKRAAARAGNTLSLPFVPTSNAGDTSLTNNDGSVSPCSARTVDLSTTWRRSRALDEKGNTVSLVVLLAVKGIIGLPAGDEDDRDRFFFDVMLPSKKGKGKGKKAFGARSQFALNPPSSCRPAVYEVLPYVHNKDVEPTYTVISEEQPPIAGSRGSRVPRESTTTSFFTGQERVSQVPALNCLAYPGTFRKKESKKKATEGEGTAAEHSQQQRFENYSLFLTIRDKNSVVPVLEFKPDLAGLLQQQQQPKRRASFDASASAATLSLLVNGEREQEFAFEKKALTVFGGGRGVHPRVVLLLELEGISSAEYDRRLDAGEKFGTFPTTYQYPPPQGGPAKILQKRPLSDETKQQLMEAKLAVLQQRLPKRTARFFTQSRALFEGILTQQEELAAIVFGERLRCWEIEQEEQILWTTLCRWCHGEREQEEEKEREDEKQHQEERKREEEEEKEREAKQHQKFEENSEGEEVVPIVAVGNGELVYGKARSPANRSPLSSFALAGSPVAELLGKRTPPSSFLSFEENANFRSLRSVPLDIMEATRSAVGNRRPSRDTGASNKTMLDAMRSGGASHAVREEERKSFEEKSSRAVDHLFVSYSHRVAAEAAEASSARSVSPVMLESEGANEEVELLATTPDLNPAIGVGDYDALSQAMEKLITQTPPRRHDGSDDEVNLEGTHATSTSGSLDGVVPFGMAPPSTVITRVFEGIAEVEETWEEEEEEAPEQRGGVEAQRKRRAVGDVTPELMETVSSARNRPLTVVPDEAFDFARTASEERSRRSRSSEQQHGEEYRSPSPMDHHLHRQLHRRRSSLKERQVQEELDVQALAASLRSTQLRRNPSPLLRRKLSSHYGIRQALEEQRVLQAKVMHDVEEERARMRAHPSQDRSTSSTSLHHHHSQHHLQQ